MKQFNLSIEKRKMSFGELSIIALGERGRGRYESIIPIQGNIEKTDFVQISQTKTGKPKIVKSTDTRDTSGWLARISTCGTYTKNTYGWVSVHKSCIGNVKTIATGNGAEGLAGRTGYWADYLLEIKDGTLLKVKRHGGYKMPAYFLYFSDKTVIKINIEEIEIFLEFLDNLEYSYECGAEQAEFFEEIKVIH